MTDLECRLAAAADLVAALRELEDDGRNLIAAFVGEGPFIAFRHYPEDDVWDEATRAQFYFHAHNPDMRGDEVGHIHCFHRPGGRNSEAAPHHLVAISLDAAGRPSALFTTNGWVTEETFLPAAQACAIARNYAPTGSDVTHRVVAALYRLYRDEIVALLRERDAVLAAHDGIGDPLEDKGIEIVSSRKIDLESTLDDLRRSLPA